MDDAAHGPHHAPQPQPETAVEAQQPAPYEQAQHQPAVEAQPHAPHEQPPQPAPHVHELQLALREHLMPQHQQVQQGQAPYPQHAPQAPQPDYAQYVPPPAPPEYQPPPQAEYPPPQHAEYPPPPQAEYPPPPQAEYQPPPQAEYQPPPQAEYQPPPQAEYQPPPQPAYQPQTVQPAPPQHVPHGAQWHYVGHVISVSGSRINGVFEAAGGGGDGTAAASPVQIGTMLKIGTPTTMVLGIVSGMRTEDKIRGTGSAEKKILDIELLGEHVRSPKGDGTYVFQRGVSIYPTLGESILTCSPQELAVVFARPEESNVLIGTLFQDEGLPAYVVTDDLLGKHFAVLGTTGSGKSCAVALILHAILASHPNGHVVLLDPHNEYGQAFRDKAELLGPDNLQLPYWLLNFEEICEVLVDRSRSDAEAQAEILGRAILAAKKKFVGEHSDTTYITVDTPTPYNLSELIKHIDTSMGQLDKPENSLPYLRLKSRLEALRGDRRFDFMFAGLMVTDNMPEIVARILRVPVAGKPLTILDLSGVPSEIVDIVVSVMCRMIFDFALWSGVERSLPVLLVCEEAHRYVPHGDAAGFVPSKKVLSRIAKEGRKYGVSLGLVSQRPSELSTSILSQCNTLFALRMSNERDQEFVRRALPESAKGLLSALPSLRVQEAIAVGEGVTVPMRIKFRNLEDSQRPRSGNARFSAAWQNDVAPEQWVSDVITRWRKQIR